MRRKTATGRPRYTLQEIADKFGLTRQRVAQIVGPSR